ncbi:alpha-E domain-containing protein [Acinetobacter sp. NIPH 2699]|uniref:alpha-E domain-containing protein n=1 Tax=Acinetobacter sp. NIPH 2699 TaxID=2923433 RepID=UPI001F4AC40B|nr:alpha-E domain-containing protein [Acinetobacter sp. NIPH 2699]MCH7337005.1 alpha-E domain-containing protein [Acinetobacter sp. NIPH 2699]
MVLLRSNAEHIYWLGRYLFRIDHVAQQLPLTNDQQAAAFAQALYLQIEDAESLNQFMLDRKQPYSLLSQLEVARDNIQELRGLLSSQAYAELNHLIKNAPSDALMISDIVKQCCAILDAEQEEVCLFLHIGQNVECIDTYFRFQHDINNVLDTIEPVIERLFHIGWSDLQPSWEILKDQPYLNQFYAFTYKLENQFEVSS